MGLGAYEGSKCAYCDRRGATIYVDKTEDFYCKNCYTEYKSQIHCDCDGTCPTCEGEL